MSDAEEPAAIEQLNRRFEEAASAISKKQYSFEKFAYGPAAAAAAHLAHAESQGEMDRKKSVSRGWRRGVHGSAAAGAALCAAAVVQCLLLWRHLWPVDRCREVLRARAFKKAPPTVGAWRFAAPPVLFAAGVLFVSYAAASQCGEEDKKKKQRNAFALNGALILLLLALATMMMSSSFARDASLVVSWVRDVRQVEHRSEDREEESVCRSVARDIKNLSIRP